MWKLIFISLEYVIDWNLMFVFICFPVYLFTCLWVCLSVCLGVCVCEGVIEENMENVIVTYRIEIISHST